MTNNIFLLVLRFFNLLEPQDFPVLSLSKLFVWLMLFVVIYVLIYMPDNLVVVISAAGVQLLSMMNYAFRRHVYYKEKKDYNEKK